MGKPDITPCKDVALSVGQFRVQMELIPLEGRENVKARAREWFLLLSPSAQ